MVLQFRFRLIRLFIYLKYPKRARTLSISLILTIQIIVNQFIILYPIQAEELNILLTSLSEVKHGYTLVHLILTKEKTSIVVQSRLNVHQAGMSFSHSTRLDLEEEWVMLPEYPLQK